MFQSYHQMQTHFCLILEPPLPRFAFLKLKQPYKKHHIHFKNCVEKFLSIKTMSQSCRCILHLNASYKYFYSYMHFSYSFPLYTSKFLQELKSEAPYHAIQRRKHWKDENLWPPKYLLCRHST